ncbi:hypothetical protein C0J45_7774 [Silurus meridionalis]|nr:hypothetical protein C0J45_7774 [Silurus meridionalis]
MQAIRDSIPFLCGDSASSDQQHHPKKRQRTLGPGEQQRLATETLKLELMAASTKLHKTLVGLRYSTQHVTATQQLNPGAAALLP